MELADRFSACRSSRWSTRPAPIPGIGAEERGQAEAIARSTEACLKLGVPNVAVIIGEGGSGGAVAIATANKVLMLEHSIYTVISPEALRLDPLARFQPGPGRGHEHEDHRRRTSPASASSTRSSTEPVGGAHREAEATIKATGDAIAEALASLDNLPPDEIRRQRREKYLAIGRSL